MESQQLGEKGEDRAVKYLTSLGYQILERNYRSQQGEIDIVAKDGNFLVFVEVKSYSFRSYGSPLGAVRKSKKQSIIHAARTYLYNKNLSDIYCRFDVLAIYRRMDGALSFDLVRDAFRC